MLKQKDTSNLSYGCNWQMKYIKNRIEINAKPFISNNYKNKGKIKVYIKGLDPCLSSINNYIIVNNIDDIERSVDLYINSICEIKNEKKYNKHLKEKKNKINNSENNYNIYICWIIVIIIIVNLKGFAKSMFTYLYFIKFCITIIFEQIIKTYFQ